MKFKFAHTRQIAIICFAFFTVGSTLVTVSCNSGSIDNGVVKFKMDGADWISAPPGHPDLKYEEEAITDGNSMVRIEAFAADGSHIALTVFNEAGISAGTYPITDTGNTGFYKDDFTAGGGYLTNGIPDNPGSITITSLTDEAVSGTFSFTIRSSGDPEDLRKITEGSFDVKFSYY